MHFYDWFCVHHVEHVVVAAQPAFAHGFTRPAPSSGICAFQLIICSLRCWCVRRCGSSAGTCCLTQSRGVHYHTQQSSQQQYSPSLSWVSGRQARHIMRSGYALAAIRHCQRGRMLPSTITRSHRNTAALGQHAGCRARHDSADPTIPRRCTTRHASGVQGHRRERAWNRV
jgi:hypothetical protein